MFVQYLNIHNNFKHYYFNILSYYAYLTTIIFRMAFSFENQNDNAFEDESQF